MKKQTLVKTFFLLLFILMSIYFLFVRSELYESKTVLMVKDLSSSQPIASFGLALLGAGVDSQTQETMVVKEYILSLDMFQLIDKKFNLTQHYKSNALDPIERMSSSDTTEETLEFYRNRCTIEYDETSGLLHLAFAHTDPAIAQKILIFIVAKVENAINEFNKRKAIQQLKFIVKEHQADKKKLYSSVKELEEYQNSHLLLDPSAEAKTSSSIMAKLKAKLTEKKIEYSTKSTYLNTDNYELTSLKSEIKQIKSSIANYKNSLTSSQKPGLNKILFEYEKLQKELEFNTEIYKNSLIQLKATKIDTLKQAKILIIISKPNMPDGYTYPDEPKVLITLILVMFMLYGIFAMIQTIIQDHKE